jgi:hypothetical protein
VLVERLAAAHAEIEAATVQDAAGGRRLGDDRGVIRTVGQVTPVVTGNDVACASAPITDQTKPLWPCSSFHGWKWSEIHNAWKPACSARLACSTSSVGVYSSLARK